MRTALALLAFALAGAGCARHAAPETAAANFMTGRVCDHQRAPREDAIAWREARGDGFTYCVPDGWRPIGARAQRWTSSAADVAWGEQASAFERRVPFVIPASRGGNGNVPFGARTVTETIDGATVRLEIMDGTAGESWRVAASWLEPSLRLYATARTATASGQVLTVFRSVRFAK